MPKHIVAIVICNNRSNISFLVLIFSMLFSSFAWAGQVEEIKFITLIAFIVLSLQALLGGLLFFKRKSWIFLKYLLFAMLGWFLAMSSTGVIGSFLGLSNIGLALFFISVSVGGPAIYALKKYN